MNPSESKTQGLIDIGFFEDVKGIHLSLVEAGDEHGYTICNRTVLLMKRRPDLQSILMDRVQSRQPPHALDFVTCADCRDDLKEAKQESQARP